MRRAEDVGVRDGAHADRVGRGRRRAGRPEAEEVAVVPGRDDRHDAGAYDVRDRLDEDVRARIGLRAAAREVDDVHPVAHRGLERGHDLGAVRGAAAAERRRRGDVEDAVVADVRARRDSLEVVHRRMAAALLTRRRTLVGPPRRRSCTPAITPGDERPVERAVAIERRTVRTRPRESASDDHLRATSARAPSGSPVDTRSRWGRGTDARGRRRRRRRRP